MRSFYTYLTDQRALDASAAVGVKAPAVDRNLVASGLKDVNHLGRLLDAAPPPVPTPMRSSAPRDGMVQVEYRDDRVCAQRPPELIKRPTH